MKKLYKSYKDKILSGVCAGIAKTYNIDVAIVRILFVIFSLYYGIFIFIYFILAIILDEK